MLIGLIGKKRSGKDTVAEYLCQNHGFKRYAFADPLKEICKLMFELSDSQLYGDQKEVVDPRWGVSPRVIFQTFGTDIVRDRLHDYIPGVTESFWIDKFVRWYADHSAENIVISDCRMLNEAEAILKLGGKLYSINRELSSLACDTHITEQLCIPTELFTPIDNNGTLEDLYKNVENTINF